LLEGETPQAIASSDSELGKVWPRILGTSEDGHYGEVVRALTQYNSPVLTHRRHGARPGLTTHKLKARIHSRTPLHEGFLKLYRYEFDVEQHRGGIKRITWEVMERGHAVAVLGHDPKRDAVVLVNEFRPGALVSNEYPYRDNLVAGAIDAGETAQQAAVREMREETNLELCDPILIHPGAYVSSGGTSEKISLVYGTVDTSVAGGVHGEAHTNEDILTSVLPAQLFIDRVRRGEINDLKTLVAGYWFAERHAMGTLK
jgi:ADP-ribose pyrophosphatase